jgi:AcrR family transcriptional regulator
VPQERGVRTARGERRRQVLVRAAADLLLDEGLASLSHRAVAARAGLPLAATTYYFDSVEDLRDEALQAVAQGWLERAGAVVDALPTRIGPVQAARAVAGVVGTDAPSRSCSWSTSAASRPAGTRGCGRWSPPGTPGSPAWCGRSCCEPACPPAPGTSSWCWAWPTGWR